MPPPTTRIVAKNSLVLSKKRRGLPKDDRAYDDEDEDQEAKKQRSCADPSALVDLFARHPHIADAVFSYLGTRDLRTLCSATSRSLRQIIRHEHVVRSALLQGGHAKTSMERLVNLLRPPRQIWTPTPLRLLRLVNGTRCEKCHEAKVQVVSADFGVFMSRDANCYCLVTNVWARWLTI